MDNSSGLVDLQGNPLHSKRNNQTPLNQRVGGFKKLGKNELSKRLTTATKLLDQWMQGVIELGARLLMLNPEDEFFGSLQDDKGKDNSTLQMIKQRCKERIMQSSIETITFTFSGDKEDVVVYVGDEKRKLIQQIKEQYEKKKGERKNGDETGSGTG